MKRMKRMTYLTLLITIEIVLSSVPFLGYIPLGFVNATTLHLPVIIAGIILGKKEGAFVGFIFGISSLLKNTFTPNLTSFLFSPFFSVGSVSGNFASVLIALVPRMMIGVVSGFIYSLFQHHITSNLRALCASIAASLCNTILVLAGAALFFAEAYASAQGIAVSSLFTFSLSVVLTNGVAEAGVAAVICPILIRAFKKIIRN